MDATQQQGRSAYQVMHDVVAALFVREVKTRFGQSKLGYFWVLAEPVGLILVIATVFSAAGRTSVVGADIPLFLLTGVLPFTTFRKVQSVLTNAIQSNKALFVYRQVTPFDTLLTRFLIELVVFSLSYVVLLVIFAWLGFDVMPAQPLEFILVNLLVVLMGAGFGLIICAGKEHWQDIDKVMALAMRPMFFISGIFFVVTSIPGQYWHLLSWNPLLHINELSRSAFFVSYQTPLGSWLYVGVFTLMVNALGLALYRINRDRFIAS